MMRIQFIDYRPSGDVQLAGDGLLRPAGEQEFSALALNACLLAVGPEHSAEICRDKAAAAPFVVDPVAA